MGGEAVSITPWSSQKEVGKSAVLLDLGTEKLSANLLCFWSSQTNIGRPIKQLKFMKKYSVRLRIMYLIKYLNYCCQHGLSQPGINCAEVINCSSDGLSWYGTVL